MAKDQFCQNFTIVPFSRDKSHIMTPQQAVTMCKAAKNTEPPSHKQVLPVKETIPPGKNCDHQWRFKQTSKTPGRKKSGLTLRFAVHVHDIIL